MKPNFLSFLLIYALPQLLFAQAGSIDQSFGVNGLAQLYAHSSGSSTAWAAEIASDGKILIGGNGNYAYITRFFTDGTIDSTFGEYGVHIFPNFFPSNLKALADGKILLSGDVQIARLNADGSDDITFNCILPGTVNHISHISEQPDGKILVAMSGDLAPFNQCCVARYLENGDLDPTFGLNGYAYNTTQTPSQAKEMTTQQDGKILVSSYSGPHKLVMTRYLSNGAVDPDFGANGLIAWDDDFGEDYIGKNIVVQPDGNILVAVESYMLNTLYPFDFIKQLSLYRLHANGAPDSTFGINGRNVIDLFTTTYGVFLQNDAKIQVVGSNEYESGIVQFLPNGDVDPDFPIQYLSDVHIGNSDNRLGFAQQSDGKIVAALSVSIQIPMFASPPNLYMTRLLPDGTTDPNFGNSAWGGYISVPPPSSGNDLAEGMAVQPDGKILVFGKKYNFRSWYNNYQWVPSPSLSRFNRDGAIDPTWSISAYSIFPIYDPTLTTINFYGVAPLADGKTLLAYSFNGFKISRFKTTATIDSTFGVNGSIVAPNQFQGYVGMLVQSDGKFLIATKVQNNAIMISRFGATGAPDLSYGTTGSILLENFGNCVGIQLLPNGKLALAGDGGQLAQITADGQFDTAFNNNGLAQCSLPGICMAIAQDGSIILGSQATSAAFNISRIKVDGSGLDSGFGNGAGSMSFPVTGAPIQLKSIAVQPDGKVVVTGSTTGGDLVLARSTKDGKVDSTFAGTGLSFADFGFHGNWPVAIAMQPNGKMVVAANIAQLSGNRISLVRFLSGLAVGTTESERPQAARMAVPNPFSNILYLDFSNLPGVVKELVIFNVHGEMVLDKKHVSTNQLSIQALEAWAPGVYFLRVNTELGVYVEKIVKR